MHIFQLQEILQQNKNANVDFLTIKTTSEIWVSMKDVIYGICETKNLSKDQVHQYKMT